MCGVCWSHQRADSSVLHTPRPRCRPAVASRSRARHHGHGLPRSACSARASISCPTPATESSSTSSSGTPSINLTSEGSSTTHQGSSQSTRATGGSSSLQPETAARSVRVRANHPHQASLPSSGYGAGLARIGSRRRTVIATTLTVPGATPSERCARTFCAGGHSAGRARPPNRAWCLPRGGRRRLYRALARSSSTVRCHPGRSLAPGLPEQVVADLAEVQVRELVAEGVGRKRDHPLHGGGEAP